MQCREDVGVRDFGVETGVEVLLQMLNPCQPQQRWFIEIGRFTQEYQAFADVFGDESVLASVLF